MLLYTTRHRILYDFNSFNIKHQPTAVSKMRLFLIESNPKVFFFVFFCWWNKRKCKKSYGLLDMLQYIYMHQENMNIYYHILLSLYNTCVCAGCDSERVKQKINRFGVKSRTGQCSSDSALSWTVLTWALSFSPPSLFSFFFISISLVRGPLFSDCSRLHNWNAD